MTDPKEIADLALTVVASTAAAATMPHSVTPSIYPPSLDGSPLAFFAALFATSLLSALSLSQILTHISEANREAALVRRFGDRLVGRRIQSFWTASSLYRWKLSCLYLTIFLGAAGDALVLLLWHETTGATMEWLLLIDRAMDGATIVPFLAAFALASWTEQAIPALLSYPEPKPVRPPKWDRIRDHVRIGVLLTLIAAGVTLGKAYA